MVFLLAIHILIAQAPPHEDCIPHNPQTLYIEQNEAMGFWRLADGHSSMLLFATEEDARNGLALASRYTALCFIGRHASNGNRRRYFVHYWKGPTGKQTVISPETCQAYEASGLRAEDKGSAGWLVTDGASFRVPVDNNDDAQLLIILARQYTSHCVIGSADPPSPLNRVDYWK